MNMIVVFYMFFAIGMIFLVAASFGTFVFKKSDVDAKDIFLQGSFIFRNPEKFVDEKRLKFIKATAYSGAGFVMLASISLVLASI